MMAGTCALFWLTVYTCVYICTAQKIIRPEKIKAVLGQDATLTCQVPNNNSITAVKCNRSGQEGYVFVYRDGHIKQRYHIPSYQNRVYLQDKEMKDGNASLVVMNVTTNDTGRYECSVHQIASENITITNFTFILKVVEPGNKEGISGDRGDKDGITGDGEDKNGGEKDGGNMVALILRPIGGLALVFVIGFLIYKLWIRKTPNNSVSTDVAETIPMSTFSQSAGPTTASAPLMGPSAETIPMSTFSQSAGPTTASAPLMGPSAEEQTEM